MNKEKQKARPNWLSTPTGKISVGITVGLALIYVIVFSIVVMKQKGKDNQNEITGETTEEQQVEKKMTVIVDAGHGGRDPGKVSPNNNLEKDINLAIAMKLRDSLIKNNYEVIMTRDSDQVMSAESGKSKKMADLNNRISIINNSDADIVISIHQNSFTDPKIKGAQVFYYLDNMEGEKLATYIKTNINQDVDPTNKREIKGNKSFYILKESNKPMAIVECGFLSNPEEEAKLISSEYQDKLVSAITKSVEEYYTQNKTQNQSEAQNETQNEIQNQTQKELP